MCRKGIVHWISEVLLAQFSLPMYKSGLNLWMFYLKKGSQYDCISPRACELATPHTRLSSTYGWVYCFIHVMRCCFLLLHLLQLVITLLEGRVDTRLIPTEAVYLLLQRLHWGLRLCHCRRQCLPARHCLPGALAHQKTSQPRPTWAECEASVSDAGLTFGPRWARLWCFLGRTTCAVLLPPSSLHYSMTINYPQQCPLLLSRDREGTTAFTGDRQTRLVRNKT